MLGKGELAKIPFFVEKSAGGSWLALPECFADVLCEGRQAISVLYGKRRLKD